ncbi:MAG: glycosyltransferase family 1 protein, partial [Candidatus Omnitrophota bacterium]
LTGNETYAINLIKSLIAVYPNEDWLVYVSAEGVSQLKDINKGKVILKELKSKNPIERYLFELPKLLNSDRPDVLHTQYHGPIPLVCPVALTVHDISYERYPQYFSFLDQLRLKIFVPFFIKQSAQVITISEFSKKEIVAKYNVDTKKVSVIYCGIDSDFFNFKEEDSDKNILDSLGVRQPYLLYVGALQPRKNVEGALKAALPLIKKNPLLKIIIVGPKAWKYSGIQKVIAQESDLKKAVMFTGFVEKIALRALYRNSLAFVYIPFYEGFGLPVIEAMACGSPVITSNVTSLPEVAGEAAILVDPQNLNEITTAMDRIVSSAALRDELRQKGFRRAKDFSWQKAAKETFAIYQKAAGLNDA